MNVGVIDTRKFYVIVDQKGGENHIKLFLWLFQLELEKNLQNKRREALEKMKSQAEETNQVEREIYTAGHKLKTLVQENLRFKEVT